MMRKTTLLLLSVALTVGVKATGQTQMVDRMTIEHELAITAYNYAVGCDERKDYEEALIGLGHIPTGQLTAQQQAWADSLRMKCEAMTGHAMITSNEIPMRESELLSLDDQSEAFLSGIRNYQSGDYMTAGARFNEVIDMGEGPRPLLATEALFWRGQCYYQIGMWEECCQDLITFNDTKKPEQDSSICAITYYTMGYARLQQKKYRHARINFGRYLENEKRQDAPTLADGRKRFEESKNLEGGKASAPTLPLDMAKVEANMGEIVAIENLQMKQDTQMLREKQANAKAAQQWKDWHAPYIEE